MDILSNSTIKRTFTLLSIALILLQTACSKDKTLSEELFHASKNKIYKELDETKLAEVLKTILAEESNTLTNPKFVLNYYKENGFNAVLLKRYLPNDQLDSLSKRLNEADQHGLSPARFKAEAFKHLLQELLDKDSVKTINDAYKKLALLEIQIANSLLDYSNALSFGVVNPTNLFKRYYMETKRPDTTSMAKVLKTTDLTSYLDSIQPKSEEYKVLQQALVSNALAPGKTEEETKKIIQANLERMRWKHDYEYENMIYVNIPAFNLTVIQDNKPIETIKVVVGTGRNNSGNDEISKHDQPTIDAPHSHETPVLNSLIHSVQVNPEWNIPESIASKEILKYVQADRFYLANNGIEVLKNEKVIEDPESIDWSSISKENLPFRFRQQPGEDNALGKIKFLFKNNSSVYLHDTPAQAAFDRDVRASSHGCVRVAEPLSLAHHLFGDSEKYQTIKNDIENPKRNAKDISLDPKTTVVLDYQTLIVKDGKIIFYPDVYGLDIVLYTNLMK